MLWGVFRPYAKFPGPAKLPSMAFFLEYVTDNGAGCFAVEATGISDALAMAKGAICGLGCTRATLRQTTESHPSFGGG